MNKTACRWTRSLTALLSLLLGLPLIGTGCKTPPSGAEDSIAWVRINRHSRAEILPIVELVFIRSGYKKTLEKPDGMVFERRGDFGEHVLQGGLGSGVSIRVQVKITRAADGSQLLHCRSFYVRNPGDPILEDATAQWRIKSKPYQKLLDEVKSQLGETDVEK